MILPLVFLGLLDLKDSALRLWAVFCLSLPLLTIVYPSMSIAFWNRWVFVLVYPLLFFAAHGLWRVWKSSYSFRTKIKRCGTKIVVVAYLFSLLMLSGYYMTTTPENAFPFFSQYNPSLSYIPSSMLQNSISIRDNPSMVNCLRWLESNSNETSLVVAHYSFVDFMRIYSPNLSRIPIGLQTYLLVNPHNETTLADEMVAAANEALAGGNKTVYTVWWNNGNGWYGIRSLPSEFKEVYRSERMSVYLFDAK